MIKEKQEMKRLFVYGSLREGFFNYDKYLKGHVLTNEVATTQGLLYHMKHKGYPALIDGEREIEGEVILVKSQDVLLEALDEMENFYGVGNEKNEYERIEKEVTLQNGEKELCYIYKYVEKSVEEFNDDYIFVEKNSWKDYMLEN